MKLIIVRHAETFGNAKGILSKASERLTSRGHIQAKQLAHRLLKENIEVIYSSDFLRCRQTVRPFLQQAKIPIMHTPLLRERNYGIFIGKPLKEYLQWRDDHEYRHNLTIKIPKGESLLDVRKRVSRFIESAIKKHRGKTILIVTHSGAKRALLLYLLKKEYRTHFKKYKPGNTALSIIRLKENGKHRAHMLNSVKHLA